MATAATTSHGRGVQHESLYPGPGEAGKRSRSKRKDEHGPGALLPAGRRRGGGRRLGDGFAILAGIGGAEVDAGGEIALGGLAAADARAVGAEDVNLVAARAEGAADGGGNAVFHVHVASGEAELGEARGFEGGLYVHAEVHDVGNELRVRLRLIEAAHDAEGDARFALLHEGGDDRVQRALVAGHDVGRAGLEIEEGAAVLQRKAGAVGDEKRAE